MTKATNVTYVHFVGICRAALGLDFVWVSGLLLNKKKPSADPKACV